MTTGLWIKIDEERPPNNALVVFYVPLARYIWASGQDYDQVKGEYPAVTHWRMIAEEPFIPGDWPLSKDGV